MTGGYKWLQGVIVGLRGYRGLQTLQGLTWGYWRSEGITGGDKGLQELTGGYKGLQKVT